MKSDPRSLRIVLVLCCLPGLVHAAGVVTEPTEASLRTALAGGGTVAFACDGVIPLSSTLVITNDTSFDATGRSITLSGSNAVRVLQVNAGVSFALNSLTVANGRTNRGAGLFNNGTTRVINCTFTNNNAIEPTFLKPGMGGAIYNGGALVALGSTFALNHAIDTTNDSGLGGAIANINKASLRATNCTFYCNQAIGAQSGLGGAIYSDGSGPNVIANCTFFGNHGNNSAGALYVSVPPMTIQNTLFVNNDVGGTLMIAGGHNLSSDGSAGWWGTGNLTNIDAKLGPFGDYGGPTWTMALLACSPAMDAGDNTAAPATDQRGRSRPYGVGCDIGAFESCPPYSIRGVVSGFTLREEVSVMVGTNLLPTVNRGNYSLLSVDPGEYAVEPQGADYLFLPASRSVTVERDQANVNFETYQWNTLSLEDLTNGTAHLIFAGTNDVTRRLLASSNLVQWQSVGTNTLGLEKYWEITLPLDGQRMQFYRVLSP